MPGRAHHHPSIRKGLLLSILLLSTAYSQKLSWSQFIADTLVINLPVDSNLAAPEVQLPVLDSRESPGPLLGIRQIKKWRYIPVDQYMVLEKPLAEMLSQRLPAVAGQPDATLVIDNIYIWYDGSPMFHTGWSLNGYTRLIADDSTTIRDWQWEHRVKKKRKQKIEDVIGRLVEDWMQAQQLALQEDLSVRPTMPYRYRRQLAFWVDTIILPDGLILDGRLTLNYPADQQATYVRGAPGMGIYYRKSSRHESVAIGGNHLQWYRRLHPAWLGRLNFAYRFGANNYNTDKFDYIDWWNIFLINFGFTAALEYRPVYHKGLFAGVGLHQSINVLPEVVPRFATGLLLTVGIILP
ncbi:MAG: hypothetical protein ACETWG_11100 [Candidatus Neomarinimicrobiota bacterium]